jgi:AbrB family transcriptional regulator, transcriptional pleiotropic regulator of transition state genes
MKEIGIARRVDDLGRIVLPAELRRLFGIKAGDAVDIAVQADAIVLRKVDRACVFCDGVSDLGTYRGRPVCAACRTGLSDTWAAGHPDGEVVHPPPG